MKKIFIFILMPIFAVCLNAQSRRNVKVSDEAGTIMSVSIARTDGKEERVKPENIFLYENGVEQKIKNLVFDPSPSKIVLLVDNSQTLRTDVEKLQAAVKEFSYEIFDGDQLFVIAYDEKAEIIQEWTDDTKKLETSLGLFRKKDNPFLFDALRVTTDEILRPLMPGTRKTAIVLISDGLDRGSKNEFDKVLGELQKENIVVYALQLPDRTNGAFRRNVPKAPKVIQDLTEGTGGKIFDFEEPQVAAKAICDELRKNRYLLSYFPTNTSSFDAKRLFLIADEGITARTKNAQPPNVK
jgi:Ca-activated chloride channel homolog